MNAEVNSTSQQINDSNTDLKYKQFSRQDQNSIHKSGLETSSYRMEKNSFKSADLAQNEDSMNGNVKLYIIDESELKSFHPNQTKISTLFKYDIIESIQICNQNINQEEDEHIEDQPAMSQQMYDDSHNDQTDRDQNELDQLNQEYYLQSNKQYSGLGQKQTSNFSTAQFFSPKFLENQYQYNYDLPMRVKTEGNQHDDFSSDFLGNQHSFLYPKNIQNLSLTQLNSKSYLINTIMKQDTQELIDQQREIQEQFNQTLKTQKQMQQLQKGPHKGRLLSQKSSDLKKNDLTKSFDNPFQPDTKYSKKSQNNYQKNNWTDRKITITQDNKQSQPIPIANDFPSRNPQISNRKLSIPSSQFQLVKPQLDATSSEGLKNRILSSQIPTQTEKKQFGDTLYFFNKQAFNDQKKSKNKLPKVNQSLSLSKNDLSYHQKSSVLSNNYNGISSSSQLNNMEQSTFRSLNPFQDNNLSKESKGKSVVLGKSSTKLGFHQGDNKIKPVSQSGSLHKFSKTMFTEKSTGNSVQSSQFLKLPESQNDIDTNRETDIQNSGELNEDKGSNHAQKLFESESNPKSETTKINRIIVAQKNIPDKVPANTQNPLIIKSKKLEQKPQQTTKPIENLSYYYSNSQNPNQADLFSERTNLNAPSVTSSKQNKSEETTNMKIKNSDSFDLEANQPQKTKTPTKLDLGRKSSQQLSPNLLSSDSIDHNISINKNPDSFSYFQLEAKQTSSIKQQNSSSNNLQETNSNPNSSKSQVSEKKNEIPSIESQFQLENEQQQQQVQSVQQPKQEGLIPSDNTNSTQSINSSFFKKDSLKSEKTIKQVSTTKVNAQPDKSSIANLSQFQQSGDDKQRQSSKQQMADDQQAYKLEQNDINTLNKQPQISIKINNSNNDKTKFTYQSPKNSNKSEHSDPKEEKLGKESEDQSLQSEKSQTSIKILPQIQIVNTEKPQISIKINNDYIKEESVDINPSISKQQSLDSISPTEELKLREVVGNTMTTVKEEKSEVTSNRTIPPPLQDTDNIGSGTFQQQSMGNMISNYQPPKRQSINSDQLLLIKRLSNSSITQKQNKDPELSQQRSSRSSLDGSQLSYRKKSAEIDSRTLLGIDMLEKDQQKQNNEVHPLNIDLTKIISQKSENSIQNIDRIKELNQEERLADQQSRMRSETFKSKEESQLQINVMPPDNKTPIANDNNNQYNFTEFSQFLENPASVQKNTISSIPFSILERNPQEGNGQQIVSPQSEKNININIKQGNQTQSATIPSNIPANQSLANLINQDESQNGGSKKNIPLIDSSLAQFSMQSNPHEYDEKKVDQVFSQQQLNIQNNNMYQKLIRFVKSSEDQYAPNSPWMDGDSNQKGEQHSNTTKHSVKKGLNQNNSANSFQHEQDSPPISLKRHVLQQKQIQSLSGRIISSNNSLNHEDFSKSQRPSFDINSRRSSVLTPLQIKQAKKESKFLSRLMNLNKSHLDSDDPMMVNIYGSETDAFLELNGICSFHNLDSPRKQIKKIDEEQMSFRSLSERENKLSNKSPNKHTNFQKLITQIDQLVLNPYSEPFDQNKANSNSQKNVKTMYRKINQYFKTKYHYDNASMEGLRVETKTSTQSHDINLMKKNEQQSPLRAAIKVQGGAAAASEKMIPKKLAQNDIANHSDELEEPNNDNIELKKSDIDKLNQRLSQASRQVLLEKIIISKKDDTGSAQKSEASQGIDKQATIERVGGILRNNKKKQSKKLVIQINPPTEEISNNAHAPQIKLDFSAIKKKNGNTEFVLNSNNKYETESLQSSNEDEENDDFRAIEIGNPKIHTQQVVEVKDNYDFLNISDISWDEQQFTTQITEIDSSTVIYKGGHRHYGENRKFSGHKMHKQSLAGIEQNNLNQKLITLNFLNQNSWRYVKNYQISYLEKQIDKGFLSKVQRLPEVMKSIKNKVDPQDRFKLESFIAPHQSDLFGGEVFLQKENKEKIFKNYIPSLSETKEQESVDYFKKDVYEHQFQKDLVNEEYLDEKKRQNQEGSEESDSFEDSYSDSNESDDDEVVEIDAYTLLSDQDKDLSDKNQFLYDEEDYEVARSNYLLNKGYLEPTLINESSNSFTQLYQQIVPVLSGISNEYINEILKPRHRNDKKAILQVKEQSNIGKKFKTINQMISNMDFKSSQTDMKNIQSEYNELLEGEFQDFQRIDHDFYKKDFIKQQHQQLNKFLSHYKNQKKKLTLVKKLGNDNSQIANVSLSIPVQQRQQQQQQIKERSPKGSIPDLYETMNTKYKSQDSKGSQHQNFQQSINHYNLQQQSSNLSTQAGSLQQQNQQILIQQQQQQNQQQYFSMQYQPHNSQQQSSQQINNFVQQNTLPNHAIQQINAVSPSSQLSNQSVYRNPTSNSDANIGGIPLLKGYQGKGYQQNKGFPPNPNTLQNITSPLQYSSSGGVPLKTDMNYRTALKSEEENKQKMNTAQTYKSEIYPNAAMQSGYNKTSTLQSQQSIINQSESLKNKEFAQGQNYDSSKSPMKISESQYLLQKTNTNHSVDDNQLSAPSPTQIRSQNIRSSQRKRSIFNTEQQQQQQQQQSMMNQDQNRSVHSPLSLHSPNFAYNNSSSGNPQMQPAISRQSIIQKSLQQNSFQQTGNSAYVANQSSPLQHQTSPLQHQTSIVNNLKHPIAFNTQSYNLHYTPSLNQSTNLGNQPQQNLHQSTMPMQSQEITFVPPIRSQTRAGTIVSPNYLPYQNNFSMVNQIQSSTHIGSNHNVNAYPNQQSSTIGNTGYYPAQATNLGQGNQSSTPSNLNRSINAINMTYNASKVYSNQPQLEAQESKNMKVFNSLSVNRDLEKSTSMDRQNLVMRTKLQQNLRKNQLSDKDQIFSAIKENNIHEIEDLLNQYHTLSLESKDDEGNTFIIIAAQVGSKEIVEYLYQKGANINAQNNEGDSALHKANFYSYHHVADYLIQNGAQQNILNHNGLNPWGYYPSQTNKR